MCVYVFCEFARGCVCLPVMLMGVLLVSLLCDQGCNPATNTGCPLIFHVSRRNLKGEDVVYGTDNERVKVDRLVRMLRACKSLRGKPKIVIVHACRGDGRDTALEIPPSGFVSAAPPTPATPAVVTEHSDVLLVQSSAPNTVSWVTGRGTFFVQAIAACLTHSGESEHLVDVLTYAFAVMKERMSSNSLVMATPNMTHSLSGKIKLSRVSPP